LRLDQSLAALFLTQQYGVVDLESGEDNS
jgi:hypothetical protein